MSGYKRLRVEETPPAPAVSEAEAALEPRVPYGEPVALATVNTVEHWRKLALSTSERLSYAETQAKDLRDAADDARNRFAKYKGRLDNAQRTINLQQTEIVTLTDRLERAEAELARMGAHYGALVAAQTELARRVWEYRKSLLEGPLWDLFGTLATAIVGPPEAAGAEREVQ